MNARFWSTFVFLLAFGVQGVHAQSFPTGDPFRPLIADPTEPRFFVSVLDLHAGTPSYTIASVGAGASAGTMPTEWIGAPRASSSTATWPSTASPPIRTF